MEEFNWISYVNRYIDLKENNINTKKKAICHWNDHGKKELRIFHTNPEIHWKSYLECNIDLIDANIKDEEKSINHWVNHGKKEKRKIIEGIDLPVILTNKIVCFINNLDFLNNLKKSRLYNVVDYIYVLIDEISSNIFEENTKIKKIKNLNLIEYLCCNFENVKILYIFDKLDDYLIENYELCLEILNTYNCIGINKYYQLNSTMWLSASHIIKTNYLKIHENNFTEIKKLLKNDKYIKKRPIYGVCFICCIGNFFNIVAEQINIIVKSGLYDVTDNIFCFVCLKNNILIDFLKKYSKITIISTSENLYERFAINNYKKQINCKEYDMYYFHSKGVGRSGDVYENWRNACNYFTLNKWEANLKLLKFFDVVGISLRHYPSKHFSGNFWWSTSENLNKLGEINHNYLAPEMYVCSDLNVNCISIHQSKVNLELVSYPQSSYINLTDEEIFDNITIIPSFIEEHEDALDVWDKLVKIK